MEQVKFTSVDELYKRLKPAFATKIDELKRKKIFSITEKDIWIYLSKTKWVNQNDLELCDMVSDILDIDEIKFLNYISINKQGE